MRIDTKPKNLHYDVVIVGGAIMGSSVAWFLTDNPDFDGSVLVVEKDPSYQWCSTAHTNSCMRQQFSTELNVKISQFAADFVNNLRDYLGGDQRVPELKVQSFGYMYLADTQSFANDLRQSVAVQQAAGSATQFLSAVDIARDYPFYNVEDILAGSINLVNEGYFDGATVFDWWRRQAIERGVEYVTNEVVSMQTAASGDRIELVTLASGERISCGPAVDPGGGAQHR